MSETTENTRHSDTETQSKPDLCVFVSPWLIVSVFSAPSVS